jgi:hypothetical protein
MLSKLFSLLSILLLLAGCSSTKKVQNAALENPRPEWVLSKPFNSTYFYGIGSANTMVHGSDFQQIAKNKALEDLASEIEVNIAAQSVLSQKETNVAFIENYEATTRIDVKNSLSDYEVVDTWTNDTEYWVLYRLSKEEYQIIESAKREKAISKALHFLDLSEKEVNFKLQFDYVLEALEAIKPYLNDALKTEKDGQEIYLGNFCLARLNDYLIHLNIVKAGNEISLNWNNCFAKEVSFSIQYNGVPADNVPVRIKYLTYSDQKFISDNNGLVNYKIRVNFYDDVPPSIEAWIKTSDLIKDPTIATLYEDRYSPVSVRVNLTKPEIFIKSEYSEGVFQEMIAKAGARFNSDSSEVNVFLNADFSTRSIGKTDDFYTSSCTIKMKVFDSEGQLLEEKTWPAAKGVHTNQLSADNKAIENAIKQIKYTWIQKLIMEHCQG